MIQAKVIIFDCFGVFYIDPGHTFFDEVARGNPKLRSELDELNKQCDYNLISQHEYTEAVAELLGLPFQEVSDKLVGGSKRNEELLDLAQQLRKQYKIGLLSNTGMEAMERYFGRAEREKLFDGSLLSSEVGMIKPHPAIFIEAAKRFGVDTSEAIMVDDMLENCEGAISAGMQAIHFQTNEQCINELSNFITLPRGVASPVT